MAANWTAFVAGNVLEASQLNGVVDNFADIAIFNETQSGATAGGTSTTGSFLKRTLNTTVVNNIGGCSIASSVVTLATAGTYYLRGSTPAYQCAQMQARLRNTTASTTIANGQQSYSSAAMSVTVTSIVEAYLTITASTTIELQQRVTAAKAGEGLGVESNFDSSIFSTLFIARIA
jgi:hypothetical protein